MSLLDAHARVHAFLEDRLYAAMEAFVHLDVDGAGRALDEFERTFIAHMTWEDAVMLSRYAALAPADGPGRADHVAGDHVVLARNLAAARAALHGADNDGGGGPPRPPRALALRDVLRALPAFHRVAATLEHHTTREQTHVYPAVARAHPDVVDDAVRTLTALVDRGSTT